MGFSLSQNKFKSAAFIFSKIKREFRSFDAVNQIDDADFPLYVAEVLKTLGCGTYKETEAVLTVKDGKAILPKDFMYLYAAYSCNKSTDEISELHYQRGYVMVNDITCEVLGQSNKCKLDCGDYDKVLQKVTVREYIGNDCCRTRSWNISHLLHLTPSFENFSSENSPNYSTRCTDEISINNGCIFTNFKKADIYLQYYGFPFDDDGNPLIPNIIEIEKTIEWYIKYQILLNAWFDGSISDIQQKWGKAEQMYKDALAEAQYIDKLPSFQTMISGARRNRKQNLAHFFTQQDPNRQ